MDRSLDPPAFNDWLHRVELDWVVQRVWWLPAAAPGAAAGGAGLDADAAAPYVTYKGPEGLKSAVQAAAQAAAGPGGPGGAGGGDSGGGGGANRGVRLQVFPRTMETPMAELLRDVVELELDRPAHVLCVIQWPSPAVAAAAAALAAAEADHARLAKSHEKQQKHSQQLAEQLQALADALAAGGAVALTAEQMAEAAAAAEAGTGAEAEPAGSSGEGTKGGKEHGRGGASERPEKGSKGKGKVSSAVAASSGGGGGGAGAEAGAAPLPVLDSVAAIADATEQWRAATARAALERRRLREREVRRAAVAARCAVEHAARAADLAAAEAVAEYSFGLVPAAGHYSYGSEREKKMPGQLCRAAGKLREALITVAGSAHLPPGLAAVDVGAAPGGWSQQLAAAGARLVVSIDPAELDPAVAAMPNLVHLQCKCDVAVSSGRLAAALAAAGCTAIDYLVCDVNAHPGDAYGMLEPVLPLLGPGGVLILTLKTFGRGKHKDGFGAELSAKLAPAGFEPGTLLWLLNNTPCERTYVAVKSSTCAAAAAAAVPGTGTGTAAAVGGV
ncbi:hypothetical protein HYH02_008776 [Chlamydomonas schloesseri]|uniref:Ribosomal RNA methyltransferase FtsJ domain-containing protein n=1 Tax=Chlamydomonas schloesseri TaxID=2026947 RepID=A0A836B1Y1_9CHLO|nr:hypothetical protein HYH02_008776 [Chlamydomonas schloesseri]|eukprot:KAG2445310.1 hypothetical protein HYH02_008776 [Chlamydomonas schloesseri]